MEVDNTSFDKFLQPSGERLDDDSHGDADDIESITTIPRVSFAPDVANIICFDAFLKPSGERLDVHAHADVDGMFLDSMNMHELTEYGAELGETFDLELIGGWRF